MLKNSVTHFDKKLQRLFDKIDKYDQNALVVMHSDHGVNFMSKTEELLGKEREKVVFLFKNNKKHNVDNRIKEIRELPSMITNALKIDNVFEYKSKDYAITESLYPNKDYEVAVRNEKYVLFFKVLWEDVKNRNVLTYIPQTSFHYIDKEEIEVDFNYLNNKHYLSLLDIAENCFLKISNKLTEKEKYL
jgi:membrane-anchored protein YejM (alkaline phosphatase superfamily)